MRKTQALYFSIGIHVLVIVTGWSVWHFMPSPKPEKIALKLNLFVPHLQSQSALSKIPVIPTAAASVSPMHAIPQKPSQPAPLQPQPTSKPIEHSAPQQPQIVAETTVTTPSMPSAKAAVPFTETVEKAPPSPRPSPPPPPQPSVQEKYEDENLGRIRSLLAERLAYPKNARRLNQQGDVTLTFSLLSDGTISNLSVIKSSGYDLLDQAACALIENTASEFPKPSKTVRITVPIGYKLR